MRFKRKVGAIVQHGAGWYGLSFTVREKEIADLTILPDAGIDELKALFQQVPHCIALNDQAGYLFRLEFPFTDRRKIGMVIRNHMDEVMPFSVDDMVIDFEQTKEGNVLAAGLPKARLAEIPVDGRLRAVTLHSLAALKALAWLDLLPVGDFVFLHFDGNAVVIMGFRGGALRALRQFYQTDSTEGVIEALREILKDTGFAPGAFIMVDDHAEAGDRRAFLEQRLQISITVPSLTERLGNGHVPEWVWAGVGAALIALNPEKEINLSGEKRVVGSFGARLAMFATAGLAALSLIVCGLLYLDYRAKEHTLQALNAEPNRLYRLSFPKSPPVKDPARMFQEKIRGMDREGAGGSTSAAGLALLNEISARIPPEIDVKISEYGCDEKEFTLSGTTISFAALEKMKSAVEGIDGVSGVEFQNVDVAGGRQVKFKLKGRL